MHDYGARLPKRSWSGSPALFWISFVMDDACPLRDEFLERLHRLWCNDMGKSRNFPALMGKSKKWWPSGMPITDGAFVPLFVEACNKMVVDGMAWVASLFYSRRRQLHMVPRGML